MRHLHDVLEAHLVLGGNRRTPDLGCWSSVRRWQLPRYRARRSTRCEWKRQYRLCEGVETWQCTLRYAEGTRVRHRVVMNMLRSLVMVLLRIAGFLESRGGRVDLSTVMQRGELEGTTRSVSIVVGVVLDRKTSRRKVSSARVLALGPSADQGCQCNVERRCSTMRRPRLGASVCDKGGSAISREVGIARWRGHGSLESPSASDSLLPVCGKLERLRALTMVGLVAWRLRKLDAVG
jgi:hypothetical protein